MTHNALQQSHMTWPHILLIPNIAKSHQSSRSSLITRSALYNRLSTVQSFPSTHISLYWVSGHQAGMAPNKCFFIKDNLLSYYMQQENTLWC